MPSFGYTPRHTLRFFTFRVLSPPPSSSFNRTYLVTIPNEYSLFFANCNPETAVFMSLFIEFFNLNPIRTEISFAHTHLASLFFLFSVAYIVVAYSASWSSSDLLYYHRSNKLNSTVQISIFNRSADKVEAVFEGGGGEKVESVGENEGGDEEVFGEGEGEGEEEEISNGEEEE
ncbi:hypothetical protein Fmac_013101 [Flemingia macrophylla]|uniref:CAND6/7 N-terminal domain-containing protein n=1 Tax=Flemingia macrophylla TaxID=520843 RepID=A0ABD1MS68_9FABA